MLSIYNYSQPHQFLRDCWELKRQRNSAFSLRAWSKSLGLERRMDQTILPLDFKTRPGYDLVEAEIRSPAGYSFKPRDVNIIGQKHVDLISLQLVDSRITLHVQGKQVKVLLGRGTLDDYKYYTSLPWNLEGFAYDRGFTLEEDAIDLLTVDNKMKRYKRGDKFCFDENGFAKEKTECIWFNSDRE